MDGEQMVVLGSWPYQHTITLDQMKRQMGVCTYYHVDLDTMIPADKVKSLIDRGFVLDEEMMTVMSESMNRYVSFYKAQASPVPIPTPRDLGSKEDVSKLMEANMNKSFSPFLIKTKNGSLLYVQGQDRNVMDDIGALYNTHLGVWVIDIVALKMLREKRREATHGKIRCEPYFDTQYKIMGDVSKHVNLLKEIGGKYDDKSDIWYISIGVLDKIAHIF